MKGCVSISTWDLSKTKHHVLICNGSSCLRKLGDEVTVAIREEIASHGAEDLIHTTRTRCNGRCEDASVVTVYPEGNWYKNMTPETGKQLVRGLLQSNTLLQDQISFSYHQGHFVPSGNGATGILPSVGAELKRAKEKAKAEDQ